MMHVGNILSTMGERGGGVFSTVGENRLLFEYLEGTEHPHNTHDIPTVLKL